MLTLIGPPDVWMTTLYCPTAHGVSRPGGQRLRGYQWVAVSQTWMWPRRFSCPAAATVQLPGLRYGCGMILFTGVLARNWPCFDPAPSPLLHTMSQLTKTL